MVADLGIGGGMVVLWKDLVVVVVLEKIKERVKVVVEFWSLW